MVNEKINFEHLVSTIAHVHKHLANQAAKATGQHMENGS